MAEKIEKIISFAKASAAAQYRWKDRGKAPAAYTAGMALAYVNAAQRLAAADPYVSAIGAPVDPDGTRDVLGWYADILNEVELSRDTPADRLLAVFVIMTGLGMRESSGQHCEGRDMAAENVDALTAEAGLFQVSYNSINLSPLLPQLFAHYKGRDDLLPIFSEGVQCKPASWTDWGEGAGREFQALMKRNPEFAILYTAILMRKARGHWGPLKTRKAEVRPEVVAMFRGAAAIASED